MQTLSFVFPACSAVERPAHVGVVGSGDLEVLVRPHDDDAIAVRVRTTVDGFDDVWRIVLARFFGRHPLAGKWELNDAGATPGVVTMRLHQAVAELGS